MLFDTNIPVAWSLYIKENNAACIRRMGESFGL
jgi:hypothetical protein